MMESKKRRRYNAYLKSDNPLEEMPKSTKRWLGLPGQGTWY